MTDAETIENLRAKVEQDAGTIAYQQTKLAMQARRRWWDQVFIGALCVVGFGGMGLERYWTQREMRLEPRQIVCTKSEPPCADTVFPVGSWVGPVSCRPDQDVADVTATTATCRCRRAAPGADGGTP